VNDLVDSAPRVHRYSLHGLAIDSALALPQLRSRDHGAPDVPPDVTIAFGKVAPPPPDLAARFRNWSARPGEMIITAIGVAHFCVTAGHSIVIDPLPGARDDDLVSFTLGSAMSAVLQQRRLLPLHASSVVTPHGALLVMGRSGAGKSTLVGHLVQMGLPILADDVTAVVTGAAGHPVALPGLPALRLWDDALRDLGEAQAALHRVRQEVDKFYLPISNAALQPQPVGAILRLTSKSEGAADVVDVGKAERVVRLAKHIHRKHFLPGMGLSAFAFAATIEIAEAVPMLEIIRPDKGVPPAEISRIVLDWLHAGEASSNRKAEEARP
jgi:hypothetical protein